VTNHPVPVRDGEQGSTGFQPVPKDHCALPLEIGNDMGVAQSRPLIGAGHRLEADASLLLGLSDRDQASFKTLGELWY
jgi:hypothetical protein